MLLDWLFGEQPVEHLRLITPRPRRALPSHRLLHIEQLEERLAMAIVAGGDGTQNTTPPADDPGFANIGVRGSGSAIYLGDGWVLTATHVGAGSTMFNNTWYNLVPNSAVELTNPTGIAYSTETDLTLYQIDGRPNLPSLTIDSAAPAVGWNVIMIGYGRDRTASEGYWNSSFNPSSTPSTYAGYIWAATNNMRWGTNVISATGLDEDVNGNSEASFMTTFTGNTQYDAQGAPGDSGGGVFHKDTNGNWELAGVMFAINSLPNEPWGVSVFGNVTYIADLSVYRSEILSAINANHAPSGTANTVTTLQGTPYTFSTADFGFSDPSDTPADNFLAVKISTLPSAGSLFDNGSLVTAGQYISVADITANKLQFVAAAGGSGVAYAHFTFQVQDDGGTAGGGVDLDPTPKTMTINVTPVDTTPPTVTAFTPANSATNVATNTAVTVTFSEALSVATVTSSTILLMNGSTAVAATVSYNTSTNTATLTPTATLANSTSYTIVVVGGASGVQDLAGNALASNATSGFTTVAAPPTVTGFTPANAATNVATNAVLTVTFSQALSVATVNGSTILLKNGSTAVAVTISYNAGTNTATLTPTMALANSTTYTIVVVSGTSGVKNASGIALVTNATSSFTVVADTTPPTAIGFTPANSSTNVATNTAVTVTFSEALSVATVNSSAILLMNGSTAVAATVSYNAGTNTATLTPTMALANSTTYTIVVVSGASGVKDVAGNALAVNATSTFTTAAPAPATSSLWAPSTTPATPDSGDAQSVELGTKFTVTTSGTILGVRFYKSAANTGVHTGSLWSASGQLLATATFTNEGGSGWQQVLFSTPVAVTAGTTYVVGYHTNTGHYAVTRSYFTSSYTNGSLQVAANGGLYLYGTGGFPTQSYQSSNYWVDVVFSATAVVDTTPPTVTGFTPGSSATNVATNAAVTVAFSEALSVATVNGSTVLLMNGSTAVAATVSYNASNNTATLTPTVALANSTTYTIVVVGGASGVKDVAGNALVVNATSTFTTAAPAPATSSLWGPSTTPATPDSGDAQSVELGTKFTVTSSGTILGVRFYKSAANTGVHTGSLWSASGQLLATATFTNEGGSGWQQVLFSTPVAVTAGSTYVVGYHTNAGHYAVTRSYFTSSYTNGSLQVPANGGLYLYGTGGFPTQSYQSSNYWVDVVFSATSVVDTTPPTVAGFTPGSSATNVATNTAVTVAFSEALSVATVNNSTILLMNGSIAVAATVSYNASNNTATLTPTATLANSTTYTIVVVGGASGVKDVAGNALAVNATSTFNTVPAPATESLWASSATPATSDSGDAQSVELGMKFTATTNGTILGVSFYKSAANTGVHTGSLWSASGQLLATATFSNETASGWQQVLFSTPVAVTAGTTYVVGYHTNSGHYSVSRSYFTSPYTSSFLQVPANGGLYLYGAGGLPTQSYQSSNYWVDVLFSPS